MFELKPLSREAIPAALEKATRYRLLNEPAEAESICLDVLRADPEHQQALVILLLALTDRFGKGYSVSDTQAQELLPRLHGEYERTYYAGILCERKAKAHLHHGGPGAGFNAFELFREAMTWFEKAEKLRPRAWGRTRHRRLVNERRFSPGHPAPAPPGRNMQMRA